MQSVEQFRYSPSFKILDDMVLARIFDGEDPYADFGNPERETTVCLAPVPDYCKYSDNERPFTLAESWNACANALTLCVERNPEISSRVHSPTLPLYLADGPGRCEFVEALSEFLYQYLIRKGRRTMDAWDVVYEQMTKMRLAQHPAECIRHIFLYMHNAGFKVCQKDVAPFLASAIITKWAQEHPTTLFVKLE